MSDRIVKINELLRHEVSQLLLREVDFDDALVTVTRVDTSADLKQAKVKISVMPTKQGGAALKKIRNKIWPIQQKLNRRLDMKPVPKLSFDIDKQEVEAQRIEDILSHLKT